MLFGRGNWAVFGIKVSSLAKFRAFIQSPQELVSVSQLAASVTTKFQGIPTVGINPFGTPRLDETLTDSEQLNNIALALKNQTYPAASLYAPYFGSTPEQFTLPGEITGQTPPYYALWFVMNEYEDVTDAASKKEAIAYNDAGRPFKFLGKDEKKMVEQAVTASAVVTRAQFPVLLDFANERAYAANTNADIINQLRALLGVMGIEVFNVAWQFGSFDWPSKFLNAVNEGTKFTNDMQKRADELKRFRADEVEKLEDKLMERVVSTFFALTELGTAQWAGLTTGARIRLNKLSDPVTVANPSTAFELLRLDGFEPEVASASVIFQQLDSKFTKKGEEKQYRNDLFTMDVNDNVNLLDAGAGLLRGFDLPQFKKVIKSSLKAQGRLDVGDFWKQWMVDMREAVLMFVDNVTETLELDKQKFGLVEFGEAEAAEVANAV